ncbi:hypothetical protein GCM10007923_39260 [Shinella yambaruensis]|uniref:Uncharacterized protein n=1 Tax=Shinella yambaruensis TaxID=415996 RepID=A0ABQ5ZLM4_9HYPH|nr:hypothetical protein GCM10007923_39260 [Shinella yambaruensis]
MSGMPRGPCRLRAPCLARANDAWDRERIRRDREPVHNAGGNRGIGAAVQIPAFKSIRPSPRRGDLQDGAARRAPLVPFHALPHPLRREASRHEFWLRFSAFTHAKTQTI